MFFPWIRCVPDVHPNSKSGGQKPKETGACFTVFGCNIGLDINYISTGMHIHVASSNPKWLAKKTEYCYRTNHENSVNIIYAWISLSNKHILLQGWNISIMILPHWEHLLWLPGGKLLDSQRLLQLLVLHGELSIPVKQSQFWLGSKCCH